MRSEKNEITWKVEKEVEIFSGRFQLHKLLELIGFKGMFVVYGVTN